MTEQVSFYVEQLETISAQLVTAKATDSDSTRYLLAAAPLLSILHQLNRANYQEIKQNKVTTHQHKLTLDANYLTTSNYRYEKNYLQTEILNCNQFESVSSVIHSVCRSVSHS